MTSRRLLFSVVCCTVSSFAQTAISPPGIGAIRDSSGGVRAVIGVPGNFLLGDASIPNAISSASSGSSTLVKTGTEVLVLDRSSQIVARYDAPSGAALFAFDAAGTPAIAYVPDIILDLTTGAGIPVTFEGQPISIARSESTAAAVLVLRDDQLVIDRVSLADGGKLDETPLPGVTAPALLFGTGHLVFARDGNIVLRDAEGRERLLPAPCDIAAFEQMAEGWIAIRESGDAGRLFVLRITRQSLDTYQLPEVTQ